MNADIEKFLDYYIKPNKNKESLSKTDLTQYAVMINGPWGSGKTHFIKRQQKTWQDKGYTVLYVSLNGVSSRAQIQQELMIQLFPKILSANSKIASEVARALLTWGGTRVIGKELSDSAQKVLKNLATNALNNAGKKRVDQILILDDFERCTIPLQDRLGYINTFVEHDGCKVIVISNEDEVKAQSSDENEDVYRRTREKVIGETFRLEPHTQSVVESLIQSLTIQWTEADRAFQGHHPAIA